MPDEPIESQTVETPSTDDVPPAGNQDAAPKAASVTPQETEGERTTDTEPTVADLQEQLARSEAAKVKAEGHAKKMDARMQRSLADSERMRQETLAKVNGDIAELQRSMNARIEEGEQITQAELNRRDTLIEQRITLQQNAVAEAERDAEWGNFRDTVVSEATALGLTDDDVADFWRDNTVMVLNPQTGQREPRIFGEFDDPTRALKVARALLKDQTSEAHEATRQEASDGRADDKARKKIAKALPAGTAPKPGKPADPHQSYKDAVKNAGATSNPDSWFDD